MQEELLKIISGFQIDSRAISILPTGSGHIHETYLVNTLTGKDGDYILQKINHRVFKDVELLMRNISLVTNYISGRHQEGKISPPPEIIHSTQGETFLTDDSGNFWRVYKYIRGSRTYDRVRDPAMAFQAGSAFGNFVFSLSDFPLEKIVPVIPEFHSLEKRHLQYEEALSNTSKSRLEESSHEMDYVSKTIGDLMEIPRQHKIRRFPLHMTHNDTKINNVLFDRNDQAICVIDLDTVMPGLLLYDFGDAIRTTAALAAEDERDTGKIGFSLPLFEAFTRGFLSWLIPVMKKEEIDYLADSTSYISFMQGLRFLTDHLNGDTYFSIRYPGHNLVRAKAQFRLTECFREQTAEMQGIVQRICHQAGRDSLVQKNQ